MDNWYDYIDCGVKLNQIIFRNGILLSNNPLYDFNEISKGSDNFYELTSNLVTQIVPGYKFKYVPIYGFSDKSLEDGYRKYEMVVDDIVQKFTEPDKTRKKYLFFLGKDLLTYEMMKPFDGVEVSLESLIESIKSDLLGARIPIEYADLLYNNSISVFVERIISYLESFDDEKNTFNKIEECIIQIYSQNTDIQQLLLKMVEEIAKENNRESKLEKMDLVLSAIANTITISSPFWPVIQELITKLGKM